MTWLPLNDLPLHSAELAELGAGRLEPVIQALQQHLAQALAPQARAPGRRIGLFGGLGQGKSTALHEALRRALRPWDGWRQPGCGWQPRWVAFEVSHFRADDLEWRFLTAVLLPRAVMALGVWLLLLGGTAWAVDQFVRAVHAPGFLAPAWAQLQTWAGLFGALGGLVGLTALYAARVDRLVAGVTRALGVLPRVVIVDDLDRARVEQQRAFLRAMSRMSHDHGFTVVVCMDESELLRSEPDPESPEQLLRKTLDLELHLPDRTREDVVTLVLSAAQAACRLNQAWQAVLAHPQWLGDCVRVLLLCGPAGQVGPRRVRRLFNDVGQWADALGAVGVDDWCALLRVDTLYRLAPGLRQQADALRHALENQSVAQVEALLDGLATPPAPAQRRRVLQAFERTRMMQPAMRDGWFRLLSGQAGLVSAGRSDPDDVGPTVEQPQLTHLQVTAATHRYARLFCEAVDLQLQGYEAPMHPKGLGTLRWQFTTPGFEEVFLLHEPNAGADEPQQGDGLLLPRGWSDARLHKAQPMWRQEWLCWAAVLPAMEGTVFRHALQAMRRWLATCADEPTADELRRLLAREELSDGQWLRELPPDALALLMSDGHWALPGSALGTRHFDQVLLHLAGRGTLPAAGAAAAGELASVSVPVGRLQPDGGSLEHRQAAQLLRATGRALAAPLPLSEQRRRLLAVLWPPLERRDADAQAWALALLDLQPGAQLRHLGWRGLVPASWLHAWYDKAASALSPAQCLAFLHGCACRPGADGQAPTRWDLECLKPWLAEQDRLPPGLLRALDGIAEVILDGDPSLTPACLTVIAAAILLGRSPGMWVLQRLPTEGDMPLRDLLAAVLDLQDGEVLTLHIDHSWLIAGDGFLEAALSRVDAHLDGVQRERWRLGMLERVPAQVQGELWDLMHRLEWDVLDLDPFGS